MESGKLERPIEILLVEDNSGDARLTIEAMRDAKVLNRLNIVTDGVAALAYLHREGPYAGATVPDVILLDLNPVSYTHLRAHETVLDLVCRLLLEKKKTNNKT